MRPRTASVGKQRLFVYGTLRQPALRARLAPRARELGPWVTPPCFTLYDLGRYPGACSGGGDALHGELLLVDQRSLARLDRYEDCPRVYRRECLATPWGMAWIYLLQVRPWSRRRLAGGDWLQGG